MVRLNTLLHYIFSKTSITCENCQLIPTNNMEQFRYLFSYSDWELMLGNAANIVPTYGEVVLGVCSSSKKNFIGFIRILFAEQNTNDAEFHCGFHFESFADKRIAAASSLLILKFYLNMSNRCPITKVKQSNKAAISWAKKLGFIPEYEVKDYIHFRHQRNSETIDGLLQKQYHIRHVTYVSKNLFAYFLRILLKIGHYRILKNSTKLILSI